MGKLGNLVHPFMVKPKLNEIFEYRKKKLVELFGEYKASEENTEATLKQDILN